MVVILPYALAHDLTLVDKLVAVAAVLLVAALTKRFVEDPVRRSRVLGASLPRSFAILAASVLVLGSAGLVVIQRSESATAAEQQALTAKLDSSDCVGAEATRNPTCGSIAGDELLSSPAVARTDRSEVYDDGCWSVRPYTAHPVCTYGDPDGNVKVASSATRTPGTGSPRWRRSPRTTGGGSTRTWCRSATPSTSTSSSGRRAPPRTAAPGTRGPWAR